MFEASDAGGALLLGSHESLSAMLAQFSPPQHIWIGSSPNIRGHPTAEAPYENLLPPFGAHPTFSPGNYAADEDHLRLYVEMARNGRAEEYLDTYVFGPEDHYEYLERIGGLKQLYNLRRKISL